MATGKKAQFWQVMYLIHHSEEATAAEHSGDLGISDQYVRSICHLFGLRMRTRHCNRIARIPLRVPVRNSFLRITNEVKGTRTFCRNMILLRTYRGYTSKEIATHLGVNTKRYQAWEEDRGFPPARCLVKFCDLVGYRNIYKMITETLDVMAIDAIRNEKLVS
jgi:DNA-binding XRE family transcriptional regulator